MTDSNIKLAEFLSELKKVQGNGTVAVVNVMITRTNVPKTQT